jgi:hypothetical protein
MGESYNTGEIWLGYKSRWDKAVLFKGGALRLALYYYLSSGRIVRDDLGAC